MIITIHYHQKLSDFIQGRDFTHVKGIYHIKFLTTHQEGRDVREQWHNALHNSPWNFYLTREDNRSASHLEGGLCGTIKITNLCFLHITCKSF
jgi:hypothetical protein